MTIRLIDLYWAAGFLEGEGCFSPGGTNRDQPHINASQVHKEPLEKLQRILGYGNITWRKPRKNTNGCWIWTITGRKAAAVQMTLYSMLSSRRQAKIKEILDRWRNTPASRNGAYNPITGRLRPLEQ